MKNILGIHKDIEKRDRKENEQELATRSQLFLEAFRKLQVEIGVILEATIRWSNKGIIPDLSLSLMDEETQKKQKEILLKETTGIELPQ